MDKPLPSNRAAEIALISSIFKKKDIIVDTIGVIKSRDFYFKSHQIIYSKLLELYKNNIPIDLVTFANSISKEFLKSIGGLTYLSEVAGSEASVANYKAHIKIVKNLSDKREIIQGCREAIKDAFKDDSEVKDVINNLQEKFPTSDEFEVNKTINMSRLMEQTINLIEEGFKNGGRITGITTGYVPIDKATNGFIKGDLFVIAARPSMGKTALVMNILNKLPKENKAMLFEMEMSQEKLGIRMLAPKTLLNPQNLSRGLINDCDFEVIARKAGEIVFKDNVFINCKAGLSVAEIKSEAKKIKLQHGLDIIFIDHIGKVKPDNLKATRNDQVGQISEGLKNLAKDLNICVVALSQLNRAVEQRFEKRPSLSDLRDSGNIEQDADEILLLYREDYYAERLNKESNSPGVLEIMVAKNRDGESGLIKLSYNTKYQIITEKPLFT